MKKNFLSLLTMIFFVSTLFLLSACGGGGGGSTPTSVVKSPGAPTNVVATAQDGQVTITFDPPTDNGGSPITEYTVLVYPDNRTCVCYGSPYVVTGLTNGTAYTFSVSANNIAGSSPASTLSSQVIPKPANAKWFPETNVETITVAENGDYLFGTKKDGNIYIDVFAGDGTMKKEIFVVSGTKLEIKQVLAPKGHDRLIIFYTEEKTIVVPDFPDFPITSEYLRARIITKDGNILNTIDIHVNSHLVGVGCIEDETEMVVSYKWGEVKYLARYDFDGNLKAPVFTFGKEWDNHDPQAMIVTKDVILSAGIVGTLNGEMMPVVFVNNRDLSAIGHVLQRAWSPGTGEKPQDIFNSMTLNPSTNTVFLSYQMQQLQPDGLKPRKLTLFEVEFNTKSATWLGNIDIPSSFGGQLKFLTAAPDGTLYGVYILEEYPVSSSKLVKYANGVWTNIAALKKEFSLSANIEASGLLLNDGKLFVTYHSLYSKIPLDFPRIRMEVYDAATGARLN